MPFVGAQVPGFAVRTTPTAGVFDEGEIVGFGAFEKVPTTFTATGVTTLVVYDFRVPVTLTVSDLPRSAFVTVYVSDFAPEIALPERYHCTVVVTGSGVQVPRWTVSCSPTWRPSRSRPRDE